jgi:hypothetical protein
MTAADRAALGDFQQKVRRLQSAVTGASDAANTLKNRLVLLKRALQESLTPAPRLLDEAKAMEKRVDEMLEALRGPRTFSETAPLSIISRLGTLASRQRLATSRPTQTQIEQYNIAAEEFKPVLAKLRPIVETEFPKLEKAVEASGAPWTPGRLPDWTDK